MNKADRSKYFLIFKRWWVWGYLVFVSLGLCLAFSRWAYDDPFITYRYASNIASGVGFVYNQGERILSTTTPLFAVLLALLGKTGLSIPVAANAISAFSIAVGSVLIWDLARSWKSPWVGWTGLLLYPTFPLLLSTTGSETPLYLALCLMVFALYAREKLGWAAIIAALTVLTRSDGILVALILGTHFLWHNRCSLKKQDFWVSLPWKGISIALGLLLGWHLFAWIYFGNPLPVTLAAKQAQGLMSISTLFAPGTMRIAGWYSSQWQYWVELGLALIGILWAVFWAPRWLLFICWTGLYFLAYTFLGVTGYYWYYVPLVPGWVVSAGLGLSLLMQIPLPGQRRISSYGRRIQRGFVMFLLGALFFAQISHLNLTRQNPDARFPIYQAAGLWLAENVPKDAQVGTLEVGIIGFYAQRSMLDFAGLIQPDIAGQFTYDTSYDDAAMWAVTEYQPDFILIFAGHFPHLRKDYISGYCEPAQRLDGEKYNYPTDLLIFDCRQ